MTDQLSCYVGVVGCTVDHFQSVLKWAQEPESARGESIASSLALYHDWVKRHDEIVAKKKAPTTLDTNSKTCVHPRG